MNGVGVIDQFLNVFTTYIDSGFGLLKPEVGFLSAVLIGIDLTLAGLFWALGGEEVVVRLVKKTLYVGFFAYLIGNFNNLASVIFNSFAQLGLTAAGSTVSTSSFLRPGQLANVGVQAGWPILQSIGGLMGFTSFFANFVQIFVLLIAWVIVVATFFILAVQLFITLIEFKLTTLAGFVLVPFGLWGKSAFLAERVLGFVISCGVKVLVLAVIVGIGTTLFSQFTTALPSGGQQPTISDALTIILASAAMLALGIFGPAIASGLVSGAPQLGAGAAIGTAGAVAGGAMLAGGAAGAALGLGRAGLSGGLSALRAGSSIVSAATTSYRMGVATSGDSGVAGVAAGLGGVARAGAGSIGNMVRSSAGRMTGAIQESSSAARTAAWSTTGGSPVSGVSGQPPETSSPAGSAPEWVRRLRSEQNRRSQLHATTQAVKDGDHAGSAATPELDQRED